jgi:hypothetical protein
MAALTERTAHLPLFSLHDAACVLVNEEPEEHLSHIASSVFQLLRDGVQRGALKPVEVTARAPLSGPAGVTIEGSWNSRRARRAQPAQPTAPASEPAGPRDLFVTRDELSRWAKENGFHALKSASARLDAEPVPKTKRAYLTLIRTLAEMANLNTLKPYAAETSIQRELELKGRKLSPNFIAEALKEAGEVDD